MFTAEERDRLRCDLLEYAASDRRISGAAITGSAAGASEDRWSDIDLAFGVADAIQLPNVLADWTTRMYRQHRALHHLDMVFGAWVYRVFLLPTTLQVDLAFVPTTEFRALGPTFLLKFGEAKEPRHMPAPEPGSIIGMAWLHALHARTCIARGKLWQAEYMISSVRDHALALSCLRHGLPAVHGRGMDPLPTAVTAPFEDSLVRKLNAAELQRALRVVIHGVQREIRSANEELAGRLQDVLMLLGEPPR
jgi:hypothetical protein